MSESYYSPASEEHIARERRKARELRQSDWWKNRLGEGVCHYCGQRFSPRELTMDHIVPVVRGGRSVRSNVVPCCGACNASKQGMLPLEWEEHLRSLRSDG